MTDKLTTKEAAWNPERRHNAGEHDQPGTEDPACTYCRKGVLFPELEFELASLYKKNAALRAMLAKHQWSILGHGYSGWGDEEKTAHDCLDRCGGNDVDGHKPDCKLAGLLGVQDG